MPSFTRSSAQPTRSLARIGSAKLISSLTTDRHQLFLPPAEVIVVDHALDVYDPIVNQLYRDLLSHYSVTALPCRARHPDRKGKVERGVDHVSATGLPCCARQERIAVK